MITFEIDNDTCFTMPIKYQTNPDHALYLHNIVYHAEDESLILSTENALHTARAIKEVLEKAFFNGLFLQDQSFAYDFGYKWNMHLHNHYNKKSALPKDFFDHTLFSSREVQTFIYNVKGNIIMEIAPAYPWLGLKKKRGERFYSFDRFLSDYEPIAIHVLDDDLVQRWIDQATYFLSNLEAQFENWRNTPGEHQAQLFTLKDQPENSANRRAGTSCGQIVVFDKIQEQQFFGYVRELEDLERPLRIMLEESGHLDLNGSILSAQSTKNTRKLLWKNTLNLVKSFFFKEKETDL